MVVGVSMTYPWHVCVKHSVFGHYIITQDGKLHVCRNCGLFHPKLEEFLVNGRNTIHLIGINDWYFRIHFKCHSYDLLSFPPLNAMMAFCLSSSGTGIHHPHFILLFILSETVGSLVTPTPTSTAVYHMPSVVTISEGQTHKVILRTTKDSTLFHSSDWNL